MQRTQLFTSKPNNFVYLKDEIPSIEEDIRYYGKENFVGRPIKGYDQPRCLLTTEAAYALKKVEAIANTHDLSLKIFDGYRPQTAVNDFIAWSKDSEDQVNKMDYYPHLDKKDLFREGYLSEKSGHTRGSTVDLTLINWNTREELEMGTGFDFLDPLSHSACDTIPNIAHQNRSLLQTLMAKHGFFVAKTEWWHFTLKNEPYPDTYFDFPVT